MTSEEKRILGNMKEMFHFLKKVIYTSKYLFLYYGMNGKGINNGKLALFFAQILFEQIVRMIRY